MDALREGVYLRGYGQKDPLIEYKTEAYDMFVELMANIKNEVLHNLFRSTSNLQAFETFLSTLPQFLMREHGPTTPTANPTPTGPTPGAARADRRAGASGNGDAEAATVRSETRARAGAPRNAEGRPERSLSLRQREEIQELLRPHRLTKCVSGCSRGR